MSKLGGWWRLWIISSCALLIFALAFATQRRDLVGYVSVEDATTQPVKLVRDGDPPFGPVYLTSSCIPLSKQSITDKEMANIGYIAPGVKFSGERVSCTSYNRAGGYLALAAVFATSIMIIGLLILWIKNGFKRQLP